MSGVTAKSTDEEYFFSGTLPDDLLGEYAVCHCKDPAYTVEEGKMFSSLLAPAASFQDDVCSTKCNYGCLGDRCFCEGGSFLGTATELCLSATLCREACDATAGCTGYSTHATLPRCFLSGARRRMNNELNFPPNFEGLVLGCIDASKQARSVPFKKKEEGTQAIRAQLKCT